MWARPGWDGGLWYGPFSPFIADHGPPGWLLWLLWLLALLCLGIVVSGGRPAARRRARRGRGRGDVPRGVARRAHRPQVCATLTTHTEMVVVLLLLLLLL